MTTPKALVLLGNSGAGKDTLVRMAQAIYAGVGNCKFGDFNKRLVAEMLNVEPSALEDKNWRVTHDILKTQFNVDSVFHLSPLDLLSVLFVGGNSNTEAGLHYRACFHSYTLAKARQHSSPVFTDIRHPAELGKVRSEFDTLVVYLDCPWLKPSANDTYIEEMAHMPGTHWLSRQRTEQPPVTFARLDQMITDHTNWRN